MMQSISIYLRKNSIFVFICLLLVLSCNNYEQREMKFFCYAIYNNENFTGNYLVHKIEEKGDIRKISFYQYIQQNNCIDLFNTEIYRIAKDTLFRLKNSKDLHGHTFLLVKHDTCVYYNNYSDTIFRPYNISCLKNSIHPNNNNILYEYIITRGYEEVVMNQPTVYREYFNESFILQKSEYVQGDSPNRKIELITELPEDLIIQIKKLLTDQ